MASSDNRWDRVTAGKVTPKPKPKPKVKKTRKPQDIHNVSYNAGYAYASGYHD